MLLAGVLVLALVGCGGKQVGDFSSAQRPAIRYGEQALEAALGRKLDELSAVERSGGVGGGPTVWRIEGESDGEHLCVYLDENDQGFALLSVKSGVGCGGELLFPR
jgi:hypothetical protein